MKKKSHMYMIFAIFLALLIGCDGGGEDSGGDGDLGNPVSGQNSGDSSPQAPDPSPDDQLNDFQAFMLGLINDARGQSRNCGSEFFPEAPPVNWDERVEAATQKHAEDMADTGIVSHIGSDGSNAGDRLLMEGYDFFSWSDNVLFGQSDGASAVDAFLGSASHCASIMDPDLQDVGAGTVGNYWNILLATESL